MKVIFLDFDGVLNSGPYFDARGGIDGIWEAKEEHEALDPAAVRRLNRLIERTGAKVVVSSSWRHGRTVEQLQALLTARGFIGEVIDKTITSVPNTDPLSKRVCGSRGDEILHWVTLNSRAYGGIEFVVLDDDSDMDAVWRCFVQTTFAQGLTDDHVDRAIELLQRVA